MHVYYPDTCCICYCMAVLLVSPVQVVAKGSMYFWAILLLSPVQNKLSVATLQFSLFVLEHSSFHHLFWNFHSQIEERKLIGQNDLSLATAHFLLLALNFRSQIKNVSCISLELPLPNHKTKVIFHYLLWNFCSQIQRRKLICHNLFQNKSKSRASFILERYGTWS